MFKIKQKFLQDLEGTEHDGDIEDYSEGEGESTEPEQLNRLIFYPPVEESGRYFKAQNLIFLIFKLTYYRLGKEQNRCKPLTSY